jgi:hypothetical protein
MKRRMTMTYWPSIHFKEPTSRITIPAVEILLPERRGKNWKRRKVQHRILFSIDFSTTLQDWQSRVAIIIIMNFMTCSFPISVPVGEFIIQWNYTISSSSWAIIKISHTIIFFRLSHVGGNSLQWWRYEQMFLILIKTLISALDILLYYYAKTQFHNNENFIPLMHRGSKDLAIKPSKISVTWHRSGIHDRHTS